MKGDRRRKSVHARRQLGTLLGTFVLAADEKRDLIVKIPGAYTKDGKPIDFEIEMHNEIETPMAFDIHVVKDSVGLDGIRVTCVVRKPSPRENGKAEAAHERSLTSA